MYYTLVPVPLRGPKARHERFARKTREEEAETPPLLHFPSGRALLTGTMCLDAGRDIISRLDFAPVRDLNADIRFEENKARLLLAMRQVKTHSDLKEIAIGCRVIMGSVLHLLIQDLPTALLAVEALGARPCGTPAGRLTGAVS